MLRAKLAPVAVAAAKHLPADTIHSVAAAGRGPALPAGTIVAKLSTGLAMHRARTLFPHLYRTIVCWRGAGNMSVRSSSTIRHMFDSVSSLFAAASPSTLTASPLDQQHGTVKPCHHGQMRTLYIGTERTPNEDSIKFKPDTVVLPKGTPTVEYLSYEATTSSPLARSLFRIEGVRGVMYGHDFITVTKDPDTPWQLLKPDILNSLMDHLSKDEPILLFDPDGNIAHPQYQSDTAVRPEDSETVAMIKELLDTRVRPAIQEDGGDIEYRGFDNGVVKLRLRGACRTCDSSVVTLKNGIENMLMHYIPEVTAVEQAYDEEEMAGIEEFKKFEERLAQKHLTEQ